MVHKLFAQGGLTEPDDPGRECSAPGLPVFPAFSLDSMRILTAEVLLFVMAPAAAVLAQSRLPDSYQAVVTSAPRSAPPPPTYDVPPAADPGVTPPDVNAEGEPMHRNLQVLLIMSWSHPGAEAELRRLEAVDGTFERLRAVGWRVGLGERDHLRIVTADERRDLVEKLALQSFPAVVAIHNGEVIRSFRSGCTTPLDEYTFEWMRSGVNYRPASEPLLQPTVAWSGSYPLRGSHWSVDGSYSPSQSQLLRHLRGANHAHLIPGDWMIESWSYEELRSLHDDLHELNRPRSLLMHSSSALTPGKTPSTVRYQPSLLAP